MPPLPLLLELWREQHPKGHEQVQLDFTAKAAGRMSSPLPRIGSRTGVRLLDALP